MPIATIKIFPSQLSPLTALNSPLRSGSQPSAGNIGYRVRIPVYLHPTVLFFLKGQTLRNAAFLNPTRSALCLSIASTLPVNPDLNRPIFRSAGERKKRTAERWKKTFQYPVASVASNSVAKICHIFIQTGNLVPDVIRLEKLRHLR